MLTLLLEGRYPGGHFATANLVGMAMVLVGGNLLSRRDFQEPE